MSSVTWESEHDGSGGVVGPSGGDCANRVFSLAPFFCYAHLWHMERHCNSSTNSAGCKIYFSCPLTSDEMLKLYRERQLKGSNLIVGLSAEAASRHGGQDIPPSFLRTLAYLFEVVKKGLGYSPLTKADIMAGAPSLSWGPPLWPTEPCLPLTSLSDPLMLFQLAPYWCYLYNHEPQRSKKTPPKTAAQMANMYMSGSLPLWTPVLGLEAEVARFNSLPPCLFMTLGSIVSLLASGQAVKAIGLRELQCYDKFIGYRSASGSTNALPLVSQDSDNTQTSLATTSNPSAPSTSPPCTCGVGGHACNSSTHSSSNLSHIAPAHPSASMPSGPQGFGPSNPSWQYSRMHGGTSNGETSPSYPNPSSPGTSSIPRTNSDASGTWGHAASHTYQHTLPNSGGGQAMLPSQLQHHYHHRRGPSSSNSTSVACIPAFPPAPLAPLSPISSPASSSKALSTPAAAPAAHPPPIPWQTALFKLFTSDASRGRFQPLWWYLDLCAPAGMHGPISAEHMIIGYLQGTLGDSSMVCGVTSECTANHRPAYDSFEPIGVLLDKINLGGHYMLVTLNEMLGLPPPPAPHPPSYQPSPFLPTYTNTAPVAPLPTYQAPATSAPIPTYSSSPLPTYNGAAPPPSGPPLPLYTPANAGGPVGMAPESSRMVVQQQQQLPRTSLGAGLVGAPPPQGLPPTHHHLAPRNLHGLRPGHHHRHKSSASRTSPASSIDANPQAFGMPMQPQQPLPVMDPHQHPSAQAVMQPQHHDPFPQLQQGSITAGAPGAAAGLRDYSPVTRSSLDSGQSGLSSEFPGGEVDMRSSPPLSPPSEAKQPALATTASTSAAAAASAAPGHPDAVPVDGMVAMPAEAQMRQLPTPPLATSQQLPLPQYHHLHQQQQQQQQHVGLTDEIRDRQQYPLQNGHDGNALPSAAARISLAAPAGQKSVGTAKSEVGGSPESESVDEHNHVVHNMRTALSCSGDLERPVLSLST
ncbi:hypothetical protein DUNSADRAFT_5256 [Dunaliella salina]|uniref:Uncharacterized protein n=1 Tax=Dunaliella salina TaxID=3046 RepID=A0ABQ7GQP2_DUNSA|nr:hypothetical protein DUNSADRAFT_5256 [Dunaliella salina]|eukprot:KAF5836925.1 hypothetical protein DUNSADRAFT_5256 [Dunaliella salina]